MLQKKEKRGETKHLLDNGRTEQEQADIVNSIFRKN